MFARRNSDWREPGRRARRALSRRRRASRSSWRTLRRVVLALAAVLALGGAVWAGVGLAIGA